MTRCCHTMKILTLCYFAEPLTQRNRLNKFIVLNFVSVYYEIFALIFSSMLNKYVSFKMASQNC